MIELPLTRFIGGPLDGVEARIASTPRRVEHKGHTYERIDDPDTGEYLGAYAAVDGTLGPEPPTLIIPTKRCWLWWARRAHPAHLVGEIPTTKRCPGLKGGSR